MFDKFAVISAGQCGLHVLSWNVLNCGFNSFPIWTPEPRPVQLTVIYVTRRLCEYFQGNETITAVEFLQNSQLLFHRLTPEIK